jgi:type I restriction-modification system DNA methylase subunit
VIETLSWYEGKIEANEFSGPAVARGYRNFLLQPGGRGGHMYFTGESQHRPSFKHGRIRYRNVARYFTPSEVIQQMVRLARLQADDRVIDMTCGSGGLLAECVDHVARHHGDKRARAFMTRQVVGIDDDLFCVSCTRALLTFLYPDCANKLKVFLHNCLYEEAPADSELPEEAAAERHLAPGRYDLVIGNPPGNDEYSGTNRTFVVQQWQERFGHVRGGLMDHHCFVRRAIELARPDGGRICLLVPEGLLARDNRGMPRLRREILRDCELRAVISLPRVFKNNNARMAILYLVRNPNWNKHRKVLLATVLPEWTDEETGEIRPTDLFGELESIVDRYESEVEPENSRLPEGNGLAAFPQSEELLSLEEEADEDD